jgi:hypothetical protein
VPVTPELIEHGLIRRHAQELRDTWQCRVLAAAAIDGENVLPRDKLGMCIVSMLAHNFDQAMPVLLLATFPAYKGLGLPALTTAAKIAKSGHVMADLIDTHGRRFKNQALFQNTTHMERDFRLLADAQARRWRSRGVVRGAPALGGLRLPARSADGPERP